MRPALLYSDTQCVVRFSGIPECMTLNDPEWLFRVKFCFLAGFLRATAYAIARLCDSDVSVLPSVRLSVRLSHAGIVPSRAKA